MKTRKLYTEDEVIKSLSRKNDVRINPYRKSIQRLSNVIEKDGGIIPNPLYKGDLGNKSWGKIDFLRHYCGYTMYKVGTWEH